MAGRPTKQGLEYFPLDVDFFNDEKVEFVSARFGVKGENIALKLLCKIYRTGYYTEWNEDDITLFAKRAGEGFSPALVNNVVKELVKRRFFDESLFDRFKILSSRGIQNRYVRATADRKEVEINSNYWLVTLPKNAVFPNSPPINSISPTINVINHPTNAQSRVKDSRVEHRRVNRDDKSSLSVACATTEERDMIFKIFFFKNFISPEKEVDRFYNHYSATGWMRGGQPITNRVALAESWTPEQKDKQRFPPEFLVTWRLIYKKLHTTDPEGAAILLRDILGIRTSTHEFSIVVKSKALLNYFYANIKNTQPILDETLPGKNLKFGILNTQ